MAARLEVKSCLSICWDKQKDKQKCLGQESRWLKGKGVMTQYRSPARIYLCMEVALGLALSPKHLAASGTSKYKGKHMRKSQKGPGGFLLAQSRRLSDDPC